MKLFASAILALSLTVAAQQAPTDKQKIASLQMQLAIAHIKDAYQERAMAIAELEAAYPGTKWDEQKQTLVPVAANTRTTTLGEDQARLAAAQAAIDKKAAK